MEVNIHWSQCCYEMNLRIKASPYHHSAEVPESVLTANYEKGFIEIWVVLSQLLLLDFPFHFSLFLFFLDHLYLTVFSLCISVSHCVGVVLSQCFKRFSSADSLAV